MSSRNWLNAGNSIATLAAAALLSLTARAQEQMSNIRPFVAGPLAAEDFRAKKPDSDLDAYTHTNTQFKFRYTFKTLGDVTTVQLTEIDVYGVVERDKSWNTQLENKALLDHEQGHFDITHLFATKVKLQLLKQIKSDAPLKATGRDEQDAAGKLNDKIQEVLDLYNDEVLNAHRAYDRLTQHGLLAEPQRDQRQLQMEGLKRLANEIKRIEAE